jgi:hypothetical protein
MTQHTPGPWRVTREVTYGQFVTNERVRSADDTVICNLHAKANINGPLIAAAPDMLAALQDIMAESSRDDDDHDVIATIQGICRAIIAKAKGGEA